MSCSAREAYEQLMEEFHEQFYAKHCLEYVMDYDDEAAHQAWLHQQAKIEAEAIGASVPVPREEGSMRL